MKMESVTSSKSTFSRSGAVTSPHTLASQQGIEVLKRGGNAIEAAIAVAGMLSVSYPHFNGIGGDAFMVLSDAAGQVSTISGIGQAFETLPEFEQQIPQRGIHSALTTACTVDVWGKAFAYSQQHWQGKQSWADLLQPAISAAEGGIAVTESQQFWHEYRQSEMQDWQGFANIFLQQGQADQEHAILKQPELAASLKRIAQFGHREFYEGELARRLVQGLRAYGSTIQPSDLVKTQARLEPALSMPYRDGVLCTLQPPTQGITTLEIMGILNHFDLQSVEEGSAAYYHLLVEAVKRAFWDRNGLVADPDFVQHDMLAVLTPQHLQQHAQQIDLNCALPWGEVYQHGDTVYIGVVDAQGNCVSMLQTIYYDWGSGVVAGDTGVLWHNRGASFQLEPSHPNVLQAGKRPFHTLNPGIYLKQGKPHLLFGTQGADGQPQTLCAILTRLIDYQYAPFEALQRPRFLLGRTFSNSRDSLKIEANVDERTLLKLKDMGHEVHLIDAQSPLAGQPGVIQICENGIWAAHDPRGDGVALGF